MVEVVPVLWSCLCAEGNSATQLHREPCGRLVFLKLMLSRVLASPPEGDLHGVPKACHGYVSVAVEGGTSVVIAHTHTPLQQDLRRQVPTQFKVTPLSEHPVCVVLLSGRVALAP